MNTELEFENRIEVLRENIYKERLNHFPEITPDKIVIKKKKKTPIDMDKVNESCKILTDLEYKNKIKKKRSLGATKKENNTTIDDLEKYLLQQSEKIYNRPWNKLEPKYKLDRFKHYIDNQEDLTENDKKNALNFLESCIQLNYLIKGTEVEYDTDKGIIINIKKLNISDKDGEKQFSITTPNKLK
tara:strand:- start:260 stop:817 length:558 start_codon:yes stop_codon:yes gene_type:complete